MMGFRSAFLRFRVDYVGFGVQRRILALHPRMASVEPRCLIVELQFVQINCFWWRWRMRNFLTLQFTEGREWSETNGRDG